MTNDKDIKKLSTAGIIFFSIIFLFFFQSFAELIEDIFALCLIQVSINENLAGFAFFMASFLLLFFGKRPARRALFALLILMVAARLTLPYLPTQGKLLASGIATASFMILFPGILRLKTIKGDNTTGLTIGLAVSLTISFSLLLRSVNSTVDISLTNSGSIIGFILGLAALILFFPVAGEGGKIPEIESDDQTGSMLKSLFLISGIFSIIAILYFAFVSPTVIARWTDGSYIAITGTIAVLTAVFIIVETGKPGLLTGLKTSVIVIAAILFVAVLTLTVVVPQIFFPPVDSSLYPLSVEPVTWTDHIPLIITLALFPVLFIALTRILSALIRERPDTVRLAGLFTCGGFLLFLMIFFQLLSSVWGYLKPVSIPFRDHYFISLLVPGILLIISLLAAGKQTCQYNDLKQKGQKVFAAVVALIAVATVTVLFINSPDPVIPEAKKKTFRVLTYNIQQGVNAAGEKDYDGQLEFIKSLAPDIVAIQENGTVRASGGNKDVARYFAENLNYFSYFGPSPVLCTFGVAILSKYPLENCGSFHMSSDVSQNGATVCDITIRGKTFHLMNNHPGARSEHVRLLAQQQFMRQVREKLPDGNIIVLGDFNFTPAMAPYGLTVKTLNDAWLLRWPGGKEYKGIKPERRIDHIFLSPGIRVKEVRYVDTETTDHPALWADIYD